MDLFFKGRVHRDVPSTVTSGKQITLHEHMTTNTYMLHLNLRCMARMHHPFNIPVIIVWYPEILYVIMSYYTGVNLLHCLN